MEKAGRPQAGGELQPKGEFSIVLFISVGAENPPALAGGYFIRGVESVKPLSGYISSNCADIDWSHWQNHIGFQTHIHGFQATKCLGQKPENA